MAFRRIKQLQSLGVILDSAETEAFVFKIADDIAANISDPNAKFMSSIRVRTFHTRSARGVKRVVGQVGAAPTVGTRVEALRGPLARALAGTRD